MNTATRLLIGLGALGSIGGGTFLLHQHLSTDNIQKKLENNNYQILKADDANWEEIFKQYQEVEKTSSKLKFGNTTLTSKEKLQEECKKILAESPNKKESYDKGAKWCTVPKTLKQMLSDKGYIAIDSANETAWNRKIILHNDKTKNQDKRFLNLGGTKDEDITKDKLGRDKIRAKCRELETKKHYEKDFETDLDKSILWCAEAKENKG